MQTPHAPARQLLMLPLLMLLVLIPLYAGGWSFEGQVAACFGERHLPQRSIGVWAQVAVSNDA